MNGIYGKKVGMTQVFTGKEAIPVTVVKFDGWFVTGIKTLERDGYNAVQVGFLRKKYADKAFSLDFLKNLKKHFLHIKEVKTSNDESFEIGKPINFSDVISISAEQKEKQEIKSIKIENIVKIATAYSRGEINRNFAEHILSTEFDIDNEKINSLLEPENKEVIDNIENKTEN